MSDVGVINKSMIDWLDKHAKEQYQTLRKAFFLKFPNATEEFFLHEIETTGTDFVFALYLVLDARIRRLEQK